MTLKFNLRCTGTRKCREGFYLIVNGQLIWQKNRAAAIASAIGLLDMQRMQIVTVREYAARRRSKKLLVTIPIGDRAKADVASSQRVSVKNHPLVKLWQKWLDEENTPTIQPGAGQKNAP